MKKERWRRCYGDYFVSTRGRLRRDGWILALSAWRRQRYINVGLYSGGKCRTFSVHGLVAEAFIGPRPPGHHVNHIDGDKKNNRLSNLQYVTPSENVLHAVRLLGHHRGTRNANSKLNVNRVRSIRAIRRAGLSQQAIADRFGVTQALVSQVLLGNIWGWAK